MKIDKMDGFCVGEPWNLRAIQDGIGYTVTTTQAMWKDHPEKVCAFTEEFATKNPKAVKAVLKALHMKHLLLATAAILACATVATSQTMSYGPNITAETAKKLAAPAIAEARKNNWNMISTTVRPGSGSSDVCQSVSNRCRASGVFTRW